MVRGGQPQPAAAPAASNPDPTHQRHCAGSSADTVLDVNGEGPAAGVPPLVAIGARELLSGRWARLNEQGISRAVRRPFAVEVAAAAALTQGVTRTAPAGTPAPWAPCGPTSPLGPSWPCGPRREACCVKNKATAARRSGVQCGLTPPEAQAAREGRAAPLPVSPLPPPPPLIISIMCASITEWRAKCLPCFIDKRLFLPARWMNPLPQSAAPSEGSANPEQRERAGDLRQRGTPGAKRDVDGREAIGIIGVIGAVIPEGVKC